MKVFISPMFTEPDKAHGGIRRVVESMARYLPTFGVDVVDHPDKADLINCHAGALVHYDQSKPMVASCHGLYWSNYDWPGAMHGGNDNVIEVLARGVAHTAPSRWVAKALTRGMLINPEVVYHGVDVDEWQPAGERDNYVLWNKARADAVSNPEDMQRVAELLPNVPFLTTIGHETGNVKRIGAMPYDGMRDVVKRAGVYLATARETFGIGTLEAMAAGVPVVGWDYGGQSEIIINGETGLLVPYGDYEALAQAINEALHRPDLGENARVDVVERWQWMHRIEQYANLFKRTLLEWNKPRPKVSVIVTCHNLARYLGDCLQSVQNQTLGDWECLVVDDFSTDHTPEIATGFVNQDARFQYHLTPYNMKLSGARNWGFSRATGRYIIYLDADDMLAPHTLEILSNALDGDQGMHIAFGALDLIDEPGNEKPWRGGWPFPQFNFVGQCAHINQLPYSSMMRRQVLEHSGGYRIRDWRAEDASFWLRITAQGFRAAKVTEETTLIYRLRQDSKGATENRNHGDKDGDWTAWYAWRMASNPRIGDQLLRQHRVPLPEFVPFGAQQLRSRQKNLNHYAEPLISVIIPVGPGHETIFDDSLDSLLAQTINNWEAIIINDTGRELNTTPWPWATVINTKGATGAGAARNAGLAAAKGDLVLFLDGDDWLLGNALATMLDAWIENPNSYIYTDYYTWKANGRVELEKMKDYQQANWRGQHAVTVLMATDVARQIGGFDEEMPGWEDWDFAIKCAIVGCCGVHINTPTMIYRQFSGQRRSYAASHMDDLLPVLQARYGDYYNGAKQMAKCGSCPGAGKAILKAKQSAAHLHNLTQQTGFSMAESDTQRMEYIGQNTGAITYSRVAGKKLTKPYRAGRAPANRYHNVAGNDVQLLLSTGKFKVVQRPQAPANNVPSAETPREIPLPPAPPEPKQVDATAAAKRLAKEFGLDLATVPATGANGKVLKSDVESFLSQLA